MKLTSFKNGPKDDFAIRPNQIKFSSYQSGTLQGKGGNYKIKGQKYLNNISFYLYDAKNV